MLFAAYIATCLLCVHPFACAADSGGQAHEPRVPPMDAPKFSRLLPAASERAIKTSNGSMREVEGRKEFGISYDTEQGR